MPIWVVDKPKERYQKKIEVEEGQAEVLDVKYNSNRINFKVNSYSPSTIKVNTVYFQDGSFTLIRMR